MKEELTRLPTEQVNKLTVNIDVVPIKEKLRMINEEDKKIAFLIENEIPVIAQAVEYAVNSLKKGGRVIYIGAGTSGRLGIVDASEVFPTYGEKNAFVAHMAGGEKAFISPIEGAEDSMENGYSAIKDMCVRSIDTVIGITASGRTPYVISALKHAKKIGARTVCISNVKYSEAREVTDVSIEIETGAEAITGSTRMKAGTAQKLVLNMISTATMIEMGKVYKNLMVDLVASNEKLIHRSIKIIELATGSSYEEAKKTYEKAGMNTKVAIMMLITGFDRTQATNKLSNNGGILSKAINEKN